MRRRTNHSNYKQCAGGHVRSLLTLTTLLESLSSVFPSADAHVCTHTCLLQGNEATERKGLLHHVPADTSRNVKQTPDGADICSFFIKENQYAFFKNKCKSLKKNFVVTSFFNIWFCRQIYTEEKGEWENWFQYKNLLLYGVVPFQVVLLDHRCLTHIDTDKILQ